MAAKLRSTNVAEHLADWLSELENARLVARQAAIALAAGARATRQDTIEEPPALDAIARNLVSFVRQ